MQLMTHDGTKTPVSAADVGTGVGALAALGAILGGSAPVDPYPYYAQLRQVAPVFVSTFGVCFVTGYGAAEQVLSGSDFAAQDQAWFDVHTPTWRDHPATEILFHGVQSQNGLDHLRMRRLLSPRFTGRRLRALSGRVAEIADEFLDRMERAATGGVVDFVAEVGTPLPIDVISELFGVAPADRQRLSRIAREIFAVMDFKVTEEKRRAAADAAEELRDYWSTEIDRRRSHPSDDITSDLAAAHAAGLLKKAELLALLVFVFGAGFATTSALLAEGAAILAQRPDLATRLRTAPNLVTAFVEECMRIEAPTQLVPRVAVRDTTLDGVDIAMGTMVLNFVGAANRDPAIFERPDEFDVDRRRSMPVLSFGGGMHHCLGAGLARLEAGIVLPKLVARHSHLAATEPPHRIPDLRVRHYDRVALRLDA